MEILIKRLDDRAKLPAFGRETGPGIDLYTLETVTIEPGQKMSVGTGIAMAIPVGYIGVIWDKHGIVTSCPIKALMEVIDSGYRDEVRVVLSNKGTEPKVYEAGHKIAQMLIQKIEMPNLIEAEELSATDRPTEDD